MIAATPSRGRRWLKACLAVSLLICAHCARAEEPARARVTAQEYEPVWRSIEAELQVIPSIAYGLEPGQLESTGFEEADGWVPGFICGPEFGPDVCVHPIALPEQNCGIDNPNPQGWWLSRSATSCREPHIDTVNPFEGTQHLRFAQDSGRADDDGNGCPSFAGICRMSLFGPTTGPYPVGKTVVSVEIAGSATIGSDLIFQAQQNITGGVTGLFRFGSYGTILMYDNINGGYVDTGVYWSTGGEYSNASIVIEPCANGGEGLLQYFYAGELIFEGRMGGAFSGDTVEGVLWLTDNFDSEWDLDNFSVVRDPPCSADCAAIGLEPGECGFNYDLNCPGRCMGHGYHCSCARIAPTCEEAQELPPGTINEITHGGWFTFVADAPWTAIETCESTFRADFVVWTGDCDDLSLTTSSNNCRSDPTDSDTPADPLASCYGIERDLEACRCFATEIGRRYWVDVPRGVFAGTVTNITRSNRLSCDAIWDNGACCDGVGVCVDDGAEVDCAGPDQEWFAQQVCEAVFCRTTAIPTVSEWGLVIMTLLGLTIGTRMFTRSRKPYRDEQRG